MHAEGWKLRLPPGHKTYSVRFRHKGKRVERSTGKSHPGEASAEAARIYAAIVSGRGEARPISAAFDQEVANFLADYEPTTRGRTRRGRPVRRHGRAVRRNPLEA